MYSQYGIDPYTTKIKIKTINKLIEDAYKKDMEDKLFSQWLIDYSRMDKETFICFADYQTKIFKHENNEKLDVKEILAKAEEIKRLDQKEVRNKQN